MRELLIVITCAVCITSGVQIIQVNTAEGNYEDSREMASLISLSGVLAAFAVLLVTQIVKMIIA